MRLVHERHPVAPALSPITRRYLEARFGQRPLEAGEAARLLRELRGALDAWHASLPRARAS